MPTYVYKARDTAGKLVKGTMDAKVKEELISKLRKMGYMTTQVSEVSSGFRLESAFDRLKGVGDEDMIMFNVQLSNMINAGINILNSLDTLNRQIENKRLRSAVGDIRRNVEAGDSLSQALTKHPSIFPGLFVNMVKAGEASGKLDTVLLKYAEFYEHQTDLKQKIKGALFYPAILLVAGLIITLFIVTFIIPQFALVFMKSGVILPIPTLILYEIGTGIKRFWYIGVLAVIAACWGLKYYAGTDMGRVKLDRIKLRFPIIGPLHRKAAISRFARTLGTLVASGVPILESLEIVKEVMGNEILSRAVANIRNSVESGERIAEPMKVSKEFPLDTVQMVAVGEETGKLDEMLNKISNFYDLSLGYTIKRLTAIIEPLFLVIMAGLVGFIMASMLLPIFDMMKVLRH